MNALIYEKIESLLNQKEKLIIAIDGMCASGKSTLAAEIKEHFGGTVISADDFFLPVDMRSNKRLNTPGGNFHRERFYDEVIKNLHKTDFSYGVFDCSVGEVTQQRSVHEERLVIIEGSYCMHPELKAPYDFKIFTLADAQTRMERIEKRGGKGAVRAFVYKWIPLEFEYFEFFNIKEKCDAVIYS